MSLLQVNNLSLTYPKQTKSALDNINFSLQSGQALAVVGESGCGKSTLIRAILQLQHYQKGAVIWKEHCIAAPLSLAAKRQFYRQVQVIFQDPLDALNPRMNIADIIAEPLHHLSKIKLSRLAIRKKVIQSLEQVDLSEQVLQRFPHEFSGGQCQRIGIARAMIIEPELLICDEPVSALDVSVQAKIINVLLDLKQERNLSLLFISHDLSVVRHISDHVLVLQYGKVVEYGCTEEIYTQAKHAYTKSLLRAIPRL
jgi:oligopeptide transport system ATP-binding protein